MSLYIHIPFCAKKCFYCSFVVSIGQEKRRADYIDAISREMEMYQGTAIDTVYVGGGTPSFLSVDDIGKLLGAVHQCFQVNRLKEWTFECNPESIDQEKLKILKAGGVSRISLGAQTFNSRYLKYLGRNHTKDGIHRALDTIRSAGIDNVSVDLMFSFPQQTADELAQDIDEVLKLSVPHVSLYSLTIEENSRFYAQQVCLADEDQRAGEYLYIAKRLKDAGYRHYEVSNFAKSGFESRHNINYWRGGEYIGVGIGAHSFWQGKRFSNIDRLLDYIAKIDKGESVVKETETITPQRHLKDCLLFGLRMEEGVDLAAIEKMCGASFLADDLKEIGRFIEGGFLIKKTGSIKVTDKGLLVLDAISARLI